MVSRRLDMYIHTQRRIFKKIISLLADLNYQSTAEERERKKTHFFGGIFWRVQGG